MSRLAKPRGLKYLDHATVCRRIHVEACEASWIEIDMCRSIIIPARSRLAKPRGLKSPFGNSAMEGAVVEACEASWIEIG